MSVSLNIGTGYTPADANAVLLNAGNSDGNYMSGELISFPYTADSLFVSGDTLSAELTLTMATVEGAGYVGEVLIANLTLFSPTFEAASITGEALSANLESYAHTMSAIGAEFGAKYAFIDGVHHEVESEMLTGELVDGALESTIASVVALHEQEQIITGELTAQIAIVSADFSAQIAMSADIVAPMQTLEGEYARANHAELVAPLGTILGSVATGFILSGNVNSELPDLNSNIETGRILSADIVALNHEVLSVASGQELIFAELAPSLPEISANILSQTFLTADIVNVSQDVSIVVSGELSNTFTSYAMNIENAKVTQYLDYPALAMAKLGGVYLSLAPDGIYLMDGDHDDGNVIDARVRFGMDDMGTDNIKRVQYAYVGSRGSVQMKMLTDGDKETTLHDCTHDGNGVKTSRIKMGKGTKARYWQPEIQGSSFEIDSINLEVEALSRKVA